MSNAAARALVVDDDPEQLMLVATTLEHLGMIVERASSGAELLDRLAERDFDVIVTDLWMPVMSGAEAIHFARNAGLRGPVIMTSAAPGEAYDLAQCDEQTTVLEKPFSLAQLRGAVTKALARDAS